MRFSARQWPRSPTTRRRCCGYPAAAAVWQLRIPERRGGGSGAEPGVAAASAVKARNDFFLNKALFKFVPNRTRWALTLRSAAGAVESTVLVHFSRDAMEPLAQPPSRGSLLKM